MYIVSLFYFFSSSLSVFRSIFDDLDKRLSLNDRDLFHPPVDERITKQALLVFALKISLIWKEACLIDQSEC